MSDNKPLTGYPSIDKPWLKYYYEEAINAPLPEGSMYEYMSQRNAVRPDAYALNYFGRRITHRQLIDQIDLCANALTAFGVKSGDLVGLCLLAIPEAVVLLYAVNKIGAISNFLVLNATARDLRRQISGSRIVITVDLAAEKVMPSAKDAGISTIITISATQSAPFPIRFLSALTKKDKSSNRTTVPWRTFLQKGRDVHVFPKRGESSSAATVCYTGGTTGESKGVLQLNKAGNSVAFHYICAKHFQQGDRFLDILPPFLSYGLYVGIHMPLCAGMEVILCPDPSPDKFPGLIKKYRPNHFAGGPLHIENMICDKEIQKMDLSFLATAAYGGDKATEDWVNKVNSFLETHNAPNKLQIGYGMTETAGTFCTTTPEHSQMIPFANNNVRILDVDSGVDLPCGREGEICLSGPSVMKGYCKVEAEQEELWEENGVRWLHTGDLGYVTGDGYFVISGRLKRVSWARGDDGVIYRVYPMKIEEIIAKCPAVRQCCVVSLPDDVKGNLFIAFISLINNDEKVISTIQAICETELPASSVPSEYRIVDSLPITGAGKIDYRTLEEMAKEDTHHA